MSDWDQAMHEALEHSIRVDGRNAVIDLDGPRPAYDAFERLALAAQNDPVSREIRAAFARWRRAASYPFPPVTPEIEASAVYLAKRPIEELRAIPARARGSREHLRGREGAVSLGLPRELDRPHATCAVRLRAPSHRGRPHPMTDRRKLILLRMLLFTTTIGIASVIAALGNAWLVVVMMLGLETSSLLRDLRNA